MATPQTVSFRQMKDGTRDEYAMLGELEHQFALKLPDRIIKALRDLDESLGGYLVTRLGHSLISATMAERDGADIDWIVTALVHDIGDNLAPYNHDSLAATIVAPYVREECTWVMKTHGIFQMVYYAHHTGGDPNARDKYKDHPSYPDRRRLLRTLGPVGVRPRLQVKAARTLRAAGAQGVHPQGLGPGSDPQGRAGAIGAAEAA